MFGTILLNQKVDLDLGLDSPIHRGGGVSIHPLIIHLFSSHVWWFHISLVVYTTTQKDF